MEYTLLYMYEHHKKYKNCVYGGGGRTKFRLQHMSIVYNHYNFVKTLVLFQTKSSQMGHNFTALIDPFSLMFTACI